MAPFDLLVDEGVELGDYGLEVIMQLGEASGGFDIAEIDFDAGDDLLLLCLCGGAE